MTTLARTVLAAALVAAAPSALAQTRASAARPDDGGALRLGGLLGLELGVGDTGLALRVDGEMPVADVSPQVRLSGVLSLGYTRFSEEELGFDATANVLKLVPAARFTLPLQDQFSLYGDAGLGIYYHSTTTETVDVFGNRVEDDDSGVAFTMRFAGGGFYDLSPQLRVGAELGVNPYFGDIDDTSVSLMVGATFRL
jgi:hypothetical protein